MTKPFAFKVGLVYWGKQSGNVANVGDLLRQLGCKVTHVPFDRPFPDSLDLIWAFGPYGSLVPVIDQVKRGGQFFVLWMTEQFPAPVIPRPVTRVASWSRTLLERLVFRRHEDGVLRPLSNGQSWLKTGLRFRYYGDLLWLKQSGVPFLVAVGSQWITNYLRQDGLDALTGFYGYHEGMGRDLGQERDIPILWLGKIGTNRRGKYLQQLRAELADRGIEIMVIDGVEHPYVFGEARTELLNRTKITVNLLRREWDNHSMRFYLASANKVMIISEPTFSHIPLVPGEHFVSAPFAEMADTVCYYLEHDDERERIAARAYEKVTTELTMARATEQILTAVQAKFNESHA
ncbi:MAG: glycosyltransferase [Anaerolineae bacterium]